jgi:hypothetical protein
MSVFTARTLLPAALLGAMLSPPAAAFNFGNMMNPGDWFGGNDRDRDDYYYDDYYGPPGGGYGYPGAYQGYPGYSYDGLGGYGAPGYAAPGYAAPGYAAPGYAAPAYAAPGYAAPAAVAPAPVYSAPAASTPAPAATSPAVIDADTAEIERLKARVRELEQAGSSPANNWQVPATPGNYAAPAERGDAPGSSIDTWQTPAAPGGGDANTPHASDWRPSYSTPGMGGISNTPGTAERGAADYRPPSQYPGQQTYELGR